MQGITNLASRERYAEEILERVVKKYAKQYVILGTGMYTFAFQRSEMMKQLAVFEVNHPAT